MNENTSVDNIIPRPSVMAFAREIEKQLTRDDQQARRSGTTPGSVEVIGGKNILSSFAQEAEKNGNTLSIKQIEVLALLVYVMWDNTARLEDAIDPVTPLISKMRKERSDDQHFWDLIRRRENRDKEASRELDELMKQIPATPETPE